jgi:hypothetical protein
LFNEGPRLASDVCIVGAEIDSVVELRSLKWVSRGIGQILHIMYADAVQCATCLAEVVDFGCGA